MHANNDSLGVRSTSVSGSDAEGRPFELRQSARPAFFIWPHYNPVLNSRRCPEVIVVPVDKIVWRCKPVTERAIAQKIGDLKVHAPTAGKMVPQHKSEDEKA